MPALFFLHKAAKNWQQLHHRRCTMTFRFFDMNGRRLSDEEIRQANIITPVMEHIYATVRDRVLGTHGGVDESNISC